MALPASGPLSMSDINTEFGRGNNLNSYRGTTYYTSSGGPFTFSSGTINFSDFYGTQVNSPLFTFTISSNQDRANLRSLAVAAGWNGSSAVTATLAGGVWIYSATTATPALTIDGSWPGGVTFVNNGNVIGMGGNGGNAGSPAAAGGGGGTGLAVSTSVTIQNNSNIGGGGGGGGGGGSGTGNAYAALGAGGGGGGQTGLANSAGGSPTLSAGAGGSGTSGGGGGGGAGTVQDATHYGGNGGSGASWGATGNAGGTGTLYYGAPIVPSNGGVGGAGGLAVSGNGFITWSATGNRYGGLG